MRNRWWRYSFLALLCGVVTGFLTATLYCSLGGLGINLSDVRDVFSRLLLIGTAIGVVGAAPFALIALLSGESVPPAKPPGEMWDRYLDQGP